MKLVVTPDQTVRLTSPQVSLAGLRPVLNGRVLDGGPLEIIRSEPRQVEIHAAAPDLGSGVWGVDIAQTDESHVEVRYWLRGLPEDFVLDSFGIHFQRLENLRAYLRNGYTSWDGSFYVEPEAMRNLHESAERPETGFAMTQLLPRQGMGSVVAGFDRHERFQHTFRFDTRRTPTSLTIQTLWDRKVVPGPSAPPLFSERLVIFEHPAVEEALREWARQVAQESRMLSGEPAPPRRTERIIGWSSWYNLYGAVNEENILDHLRRTALVVRREHLPMRVFQIDDGFTPEMGDWLDAKPQFPRGLRPLMADIRAAGFTPGLWIAPFMVGNRSRLFREHPDWVVRERSSDAPLAQWKFYGEFRWHKRSEEYYILDTTHPDAFEYLRRVFRTWRREWGCEYFKTDFMFWGAEHGPARARWRVEGMTRIEIWRRVAEMIRSEIGDATWLGCGCPLWAAVGLVEGARIGSDVGVEWRGHLSAQSLLRDQATRNFANGILWQSDPDCILMRERFHHLTGPEVRSLAIYAGMAGGVTLTSDALDELTPERLRLWKLLLNQKPARCNFPFLGQASITYERVPADRHSQPAQHQAIADPVLVQVRAPSHASAGQTAAVFIFNTGDTPVERTYSVQELGIAEGRYGYDWIQQTHAPLETSQISVALAPHDGTLLFLSGGPMDSFPDQLP